MPWPVACDPSPGLVKKVTGAPRSTRGPMVRALRQRLGAKGAHRYTERMPVSLLEPFVVHETR